MSAITSSELAECLNNEGAEYANSPRKPKIGVLFTGQGAQWANMGMGLLVYPAFAQTLYKASAILKDMGSNWSLLGAQCLSLSMSRFY